MRILFSAIYDLAALRAMQKIGDLPPFEIKTDPTTGRNYFNYIFRLSTDVDAAWERQIKHRVEALSSLVVTYCDLVPEGKYEEVKEKVSRSFLCPDEDDKIQAFVILKRNPTSGVAWEEIEFYGTNNVTPQQIGEAYGRFRKGEFCLVTKWSNGIPHPDKPTPI